MKTLPFKSSISIILTITITCSFTSYLFSQNTAKAQIVYSKGYHSNCGVQRSVSLKNLSKTEQIVKVKITYRGTSKCSQILTKINTIKLAPAEKKGIGEEKQNCASGVNSVDCRTIKYEIL